LSNIHFTGTAGDSLTRDHNGMKFTTQDVDNDLSSTNCAQYRNGAWWFRTCSDSHLNGEYLGGSHGKYGEGCNWYSFKGTYYSLKASEMKVGRDNF
jgi:hypothetical protein